MAEMNDTGAADLIMDEAAALIVLAECNVPTDIQGLLVQGDPMSGIPPHSLGKAIAAVLRSRTAREQGGAR